MLPLLSASQSTAVPLFSATTSRASLSCHYRQTSYGSGVASQRRERGGGGGVSLRSVVSEEAEEAVWMGKA